MIGGVARCEQQYQHSQQSYRSRNTAPGIIPGSLASVTIATPRIPSLVSMTRPAATRALQPGVRILRRVKYEQRAGAYRRTESSRKRILHAQCDAQVVAENAGQVLLVNRPSEHGYGSPTRLPRWPQPRPARWPFPAEQEIDQYTAGST